MSTKSRDYFISYAYDRGFGNATINVVGKFDYLEVERKLAEQDNITRSIIAYHEMNPDKEVIFDGGAKS